MEENKIINNTPQPTNETDFDKIIGYILSMLFGLVFRDIIMSFEDIANGLNIHNEKGVFFYLLYIPASFIFCANIFRMLHGFVLAVHDKENPTGVGPYPYDFKELFVLVCTFLVPMVSVALIKKNIFTEIGILLCYQFPLVIYCVWDTWMKIDMKHERAKNPDEIQKAKIDKYEKYTNIWLWLDLISVLLCLIAVGFMLLGLLEIYYNFVIFIFVVINFGIFIVDYVFLNKDFYFRKIK